MSSEEANKNSFIDPGSYVAVLNELSEFLAKLFPETTIPHVLVKLLDGFIAQQSHLYSDDVKAELAYSLDRISLKLKLPALFPRGSGKPPTFGRPD